MASVVYVEPTEECPLYPTPAKYVTVQVFTCSTPEDTAVDTPATQEVVSPRQLPLLSHPVVQVEDLQQRLLEQAVL